MIQMIKIKVWDKLKWFPESQGDFPKGMFILKSLPEKQILPKNLLRNQERC